MNSPYIILDHKVFFDRRSTLKIYVDLLFLLNLITDFLLLWMTAFFRRRQVRLWRLFTGAMVGTTYLLILFVEALAPLYSWYGKLGLSILMIIVTFGLSRFELLFKDTLIFYMVSFLFGGGIFALSFLLQGKESTLNGVLVFEDAFVLPQASFLTLVIGYVLMIFLSKMYFQAIEVAKRRDKYILPLRLAFLDTVIETKGLLDTGNALHEPITRVPVIILQIDQLSALLPATLIEGIKQGSDAFMNANWYEGIAPVWQSRIRIIPYRGVGKGNQMLLALTPDWLEIQDGDQVYRTNRVRVGLTQEKLSADGTYMAILHSGLLRDEESPEKIEEVYYANETSP